MYDLLPESLTVSLSTDSTRPVENFLHFLFAFQIFSICLFFYFAFSNTIREEQSHRHKFQAAESENVSVHVHIQTDVH